MMFTFIMKKPIKLVLGYYLNSSNEHRRNRFLDKHKEAFEDNKEEIKELLDKTEFYHGTGAQHHIYEGSKYTGNYVGIKNSLESILTEGLVPQHDPFNFVFETGAVNTTSLSGNNIYSRCYADLFFQEGTGVEYYYGSSLFWGSIIAGKLFFERYIELIRTGMNKEEIQSHERIKDKKKHIKKAYEGWTRSFRRDRKYEGKNFAHVALAKSDITNNFGIVIGIKNDVVSPLRIKYESVSHYETRTDINLLPAEFSHLQVPYTRIEEVRRVMETTNNSIPLVPTEYVEAIRFEEGIDKALARFN